MNYEKKTLGLYLKVFTDILAYKNLEIHLRDVEKSIAVVDKMIENAKNTGHLTNGYDLIKNELYYLKYEILERL